ncbi:MAG: insulinase family protein [Gammaproteobacteria bacterium]|nr:insulinase family protein [Gammaproteobacteria bacterium]
MRLIKTLWPLLLFISATATATPQIQHWQTGNGAGVYYIHAPELPMVDLRLVFDAGSARDGDRPGLALMTNALLDAGVKGMDEEAIAERFENLGAQYSASALRDMAIVQLRSLNQADLLEPALETFIKVAATPRFPEKVLIRERSRMLLALKAKQESPGDLAQEAFYQALYGKHPYASPTEGTEASVKALRRTDLTDFHERHYVARNAVIAIVGAVDRRQAESMAERLSEALPTGQKAPPLPTVKPLAEAKRRVIEHPSSQSHLLMGQPGMTRDDPDYMPLYVGNHILGGSGFGSRIVEEIREKRGLSYSAYSYFLPMRVTGPFMLGLQTRNDQVDTAEKVLRETLVRFVEEGPSQDELIASKKNITGGFPLRIDSNKDLVEYAAMIGFYGLPLDYLEGFNERVEAVRVEQIRDAFKRRVHPGRMATIIVGQPG